MIEWLRSRGSFKCAPRLFAGAFESMDVGSCDEHSQIIFRAEHRAVIERLVCPVVGSPMFHVDPIAGGDYFFSWQRTCPPDGGRVVVGGGQFGRLYFKPSGRHAAASSSTSTTFVRLVAYLKRNSMKRAVGRFPLYIGKHLSRQVESGDSVLLYPNGSTVPLIDM